MVYAKPWSLRIWKDTAHRSFICDSLAGNLIFWDSCYRVWILLNYTGLRSFYFHHICRISIKKPKRSQYHIFVNILGLVSIEITFQMLEYEKLISAVSFTHFLSFYWQLACFWRASYKEQIKITGMIFFYKEMNFVK